MSRGSDKFHVGQRVLFAFPECCGDWVRLNGEEGVINRPKHRIEGCGVSFDELQPVTMPGTYHGYGVRWHGDATRGGRIVLLDLGVRAEWLRPFYDGDQVSTWAKFAKATGLDLRGAIIDAVPVNPRRVRRLEAANDH